ncbi:MAG: efflux RND transporter periplasmic adaptor subunit [Croceibacterium sp.]
MNYETKLDLGAGADLQDSDADGASRPARRKRLLIVVAVVVILTAIAAWMLSGGEEEKPFSPDKVAVIPSVSVVSPGSGTVEGSINATGTLAARRPMPIGVVGEGGRVVSIPVEAGQWVNAGQVLAVIDRSVQNQQAQSSAASIEVARADAKLAQANLDRSLQLVARGFVSQADIDRLTALRDAARARVRVSEAQYRELLARNARLNIVAPAAGYVLERNVDLGEVVGAGAGALFTIAQGGQMEMLARLSEDDLAKVSVGVPAEVTPVGTDKAFRGQVWLVSPIIDATNRQGTARIALSYAPQIRPGGFASVRINGGTVVAPLLPESAIMADDKGSYVYIVDGQNKVVRREVTIGMVTAQGITVASGLTGKERVVLRAGGFLTVGDTVKPVAAPAAAK